MTGRMVRVMRFQCSLIENGITGWMLAVYFMAWAGPMPKSQLFWMGTLMRLATGFWSFLASSACSSLAAAGALVCANAGLKQAEISTRVNGRWESLIFILDAGVIISELGLKTANPKMVLIHFVHHDVDGWQFGFHVWFSFAGQKITFSTRLSS